jgi:SprT-like protein
MIYYIYNNIRGDNMDFETINREARNFLIEEYNLYLPFDVEINGRLTRTFGRFVHREREALKVELSRHFVENNKREAVLDVLKHELIHFAMFVKGKQHEDGSRDFERELERLGVVSQKNVHKYDFKVKPKNYNIYGCSKCKKTIKRIKKLDTNKWMCSCGGNLIHNGKTKEV